MNRRQVKTRTTINRYTPVPPIASSASQTSDGEEKASTASDGDEDTAVDDEEELETEEEEDEQDEEDEEEEREQKEELDDDFQLSEDEFDEVKPELKRRMLDLSNSEAFGTRVRDSL